MKRKRRKKKKEFSKQIFNIVMTTFIFVVVFSMALMWKTGDTSPLMYLIPAVGTMVTANIGFYTWKSKAENICKIAKDVGKEKFTATSQALQEMSSVVNMYDDCNN